MTVQLIELSDSRPQQVSPDPANQEITRKYLLSGVDDELSARQYVEANIEAFLDGQVFNNYRLVPRGTGIWDVEVKYGKKKTPGTITFNFDTGEEKVKITQAPNGSAYYPAYTASTYKLAGGAIREAGTGYTLDDVITIAGGTSTVPAQLKVTGTTPGGNINFVEVQTVGSYTITPPNPASVTGGTGTGAKFFLVWGALAGTAKPVIDFKGALGIKRQQGESKAEGIDREVEAFAFTVGITFGPTFPLSTAFVRLCQDAAWHTNSAPLSVTIAGIDLSFAVGELMFKGATGLQKTGGSGVQNYADWEGEATLKFACQKNLDSVAIAGIPGVTKKGWDYLEVVYEEAVDTVPAELLPAVRQVNVSQIYDALDLSALFPDAPTITGFSPDNGSVATIITVTGTNFWGVTSVLVNGTPAPYAVISATTLQFAVPATATTGKVKVKASGGSVESAGNFTVL